MDPIVIAGGCYVETCEAPSWRAVYGSGGRAAHALIGTTPIQLMTYYPKARADDLYSLVAAGIEVNAVDVESAVAFAYFHPLSNPVMAPEGSRIARSPPLQVQGDAVLRFGFVEGDAIVAGRRVVYDPQSVGSFAPFEENGSRADALALVLNADELGAATGQTDLNAGARALLSGGAEVVIVKAGVHGALVHTRDIRGAIVPAYWSDQVFKIGTGDVFSAAFTLAWAHHGQDPVTAARSASRSVAHYAARRALPLASADALPEGVAVSARSEGRVHLVGSTHTLADRWLFEEAAWHLERLGAKVRRWVGLPEGSTGDGAYLVLADRLGPELLKTIVERLDADRVVVLSEAKVASPPGARCTADFVTALYWACWLS